MDPEMNENKQLYQQCGEYGFPINFNKYYQKKNLQINRVHTFSQWIEIFIQKKEKSF